MNNNLVTKDLLKQYYYIVLYDLVL